MTTLAWRAELLDEPPDLLSLWRPGGFLLERARVGVVAWGTAARIRVPSGPGQLARAAAAVRRALGKVQAEGDLAPVVVGALPFDGGAPATLVVPAVAVVRRGDGRSWRVLAGRATDASTPARPPPAVCGTHKLQLTPLPSPRAYADAVATARRHIAGGEVDKVVLARTLVAQADEPIDRVSLLRRLRRHEPQTCVFAVHGFVGASPELLVSRGGREVRSEALAGTAPRPDDAASTTRAAAGLLASAKERAEHRFVVDAVRAGLQGACSEIHVDPEPGVRQLRTVLHLSTEMRGVLREPAPSALELAARLHPTPAVCGTPRRTAMRLIHDLEPFDRTLYAGIVGWQDAGGDGEWVVALRCAEAEGRLAVLYAGAGVVADSDPDAELVETDAKFRSMLDAFGIAELPRWTA